MAELLHNLEFSVTINVLFSLYFYMGGLLWNVKFLQIAHYLIYWYVVHLHSNKLYND